MKVSTFFLLLLYMTDRVAGENLKMTFNVEYDKKAHQYNLEINKKEKKKKGEFDSEIERTAQKQVGFAFRGFDKKVNRLLKLINKRSLLSDDSRSQKTLKGLKHSIRRTSKHAKSIVLQFYDRANKKAANLYNSMKDQLVRSMRDVSNSKELIREKGAILKKVRNRYRKQFNTLKKGFLGAQQNPSILENI